ncbi:MAG: hypothetical protein CGW95_01105 [Phenylobacterium zucineum]|nr:MAG: hypothetical protein CGW95_01105 [Phenylobacterium zucineum]
MATLVLSMVGNMILPGFGQVLGALAGAVIDRTISNMLTPTQHISQEGSRLTEFQVTSSAEGTAIRRIWGRARMGGQIIWQTKYREVITTTSQRQGGGGKGGGGGGGGTVVTTTTYTYYCSFAIGLCEGPVAQLGRIWADGTLLDTTKYTIRMYPGSQTQNPDSKIEAVEGSGKTPAYRGLCYLVFEEMDLTKFGNRIPQITVELIKPITSPQSTDLEQCVKGLCLIPGSGEFIYGSRSYVRDDGYGNSITENVHTGRGMPALKASLDDQTSLLPNANTISLVCAWMGDDLRAGVCQIKPKTEFIAKKVLPTDWWVSGVPRASSTAVSLDSAGRAVYGGTPADVTIFEAIQELKARGKQVIFYPFILMEILAGNGKPDPYGGTEQGAFPWRGRITCHPAPGVAGTVDKTATAATQIANIVGTAVAGNFGAWNGVTIPYTGPNEWTLRRMILHYAKLCVAAGGVDAFCISSELLGLTKVRDSASNFPFVNALVTLAADVKAIVGSGCKVGYAADWSEYHSYRPSDGTNDVYFNLDPLWSSSNVDFIGIDNYLPCSDWRTGSTHLDALAGWTSIKDQNYLKANMAAGEYYDWYYTSQANRDSQTRTAITDGAYGKPWVFRQKDIKNWWLNAHYNRPGGTQSGSPTAWTAQSKPIWFTEFGCPAIDKGTNQPNVFVDPKSVESSKPYYSTGVRDDAIQRAYIEATCAFWASGTNNPTSSVYGAPMIPLNRMQVWAWDVRTYPEFPSRNDVWSDTDNYNLGHWLNGRIGIIPLGRLVSELCGLVGVTPNVTGLADTDGTVRGFLVEDLSPVRSMLQSLMQAYMFDAWESEGVVKFGLRSNPDAVTIDIDKLVATSENPQGYMMTRAQETDLPRAITVNFIDEERDYNVASVNGTKVVGGALRTDTVGLPLILKGDYAKGIADVSMQEAWIAREKIDLMLPPSMIGVDPGDLISITLSGRAINTRVKELGTGYVRSAGSNAHDPSIYRGFVGSNSASRPQFTPVYGQSVVELMDLPLFNGQETYPWAPRLAAYQNPWPGSVTVDIQQSDLTFSPIANISGSSTIGRLLSPLYSGPVGLWDNANSIYLELFGSTMTLSSAAEFDVLGGTNALAIYNASTDGWEIVQFVNATLTGAKQYVLTKLLRGQQGTEDNIGNPIPAGAHVVLLNTVNTYLPMEFSRVRLPATLSYGPSPYNPTHYTWQQVTKTFTARGLKPFSPTDVKGVRATSNDWTVTWKRRTRFNGDSWESPDVPLNEETESYQVDIMSGSTVKRTVSSTTPTFTYTSAQQVTDFGANQTTLDVIVYQLSASVGRGIGRRITLYG